MNISLITKLKYCFELLASKSVILVLDKRTHVSIPTIDPSEFNSIFLLTAQRTALSEVRERLDEAIIEHDRATDKLEDKEDNV